MFKQNSINNLKLTQKKIYKEPNYSIAKSLAKEVGGDLVYELKQKVAYNYSVLPLSCK